MDMRKFSVAMAAILLGMQIGSAAVASVSEEDLQAVQELILGGQVEDLMAYLTAHPELLDLAGALGDALRAFMADPSPEALQAVAELTEGGIAVDVATAKDPQAGPSIY